MKNFKIFLFVEGFLLLMALLNILRTRNFSVFFLAGIVLLFLGLKGLKSSKTTSFFIALGSIILLFTFVTNIFIWLAVIVAFIFIANRQQEKFFTDKKICIVETVEPTGKFQNKSVPWFGHIDIGKETFEWDDINLIQVAGDTIIDLENTILPKTDNIVIIRKLFGKTRIIIPSNIALKIEYATLMGSLRINNHEEIVTNSIITKFDDNYSESNKHLKIYINAIVGDVEVIRT